MQLLYVLVNIVLIINVSMLQWLREEFTSYMTTWKESVEARPGYTDQQKQRNLLSDLTLEGISITGIYLNKLKCCINSASE